MAHLDQAIKHHEAPARGQPFSVIVPGSEREGRTPAYRHYKYRDGLLKTLDPNVTTVHEIFEKSANRFSNLRCLGSRPYDPVKKTWGKYQWETYATVAARRANLGAGIFEVVKEAGITDPKYGVGLWCQNRPEWQITDLACMSQGLFSVSLYDTLGPSTTEFIINHAELPCIVTSLPHIPTLLRLKPRLPGLKVIISLDPLEAGERLGYTKRDMLNSLASDLNVKIYSLHEVEARGAANGPPKFNPPSPDDLVTINYTSGTTGDPKGVALTHSQAVAATSSAHTGIPWQPGFTFLSYLPLAHIYERLIEHALYWAGCSIGFFHGDILALVDDLKVLKPDGFISVPRLLNRFGGAIRAATLQQPGFKGTLSRHIIDTKTAAMSPPDSPAASNTHFFYDRIWGKKVASALGLQNAKYMISGSAPLDPSLHTFFRAALGTSLMQGYGLTETYALALCQGPSDLSVGNCGGVSPSIEVCLIDIPDMEYYSTDKPQPRGELLIRGNNVTSGYHKNPKENAKVFLEDGWFRTGDVATVDKLGRFQIIDRVKNVLKLSQGEYVSPERLENIYLSQLNYFAMAFIHGDSLHSFMVGIFAVQPDVFAPFASKVLGTTIGATDLGAIRAACEEPKVIAAVKKDLDRVGRKQKFAGFERVRNVKLMVEPFSIDNELLTPT